MKTPGAVVGILDEPKRSRVAFGSLLLLYIFSRTVTLTRLPVFIDEAIHIWRAKEIQQGAIALGFAEGKWLSMVIYSFATRLPGDSLWLSRFAAVLAGFLTLIAIHLVGRELLSRRATLISALIYVLLPFSIFYNRLALADGLLICFSAFVTFFSIKAIRSSKGYYSVLLAVLLMGSILAKFPGILFIFVPLLAVIFLLPKSSWKEGFKAILPAVLAGSLIFLTIAFVGIPQAVGRRSDELNIFNTIQTLTRNLLKAAKWSWFLLTPPITILTSIAVIWPFLSGRKKETWFFLSLVILNALPFILIGQEWYPRYLTVTLVPLSLLLGAFASWIYDQMLASITSKIQVPLVGLFFLILLLCWPIVIDTWLLSNPDTVPLPEEVDWEYRSGWPSGYGTEELAGVLQDNSFQRPPYLLRPIFWSHVKQGGLEVHLDDETNVDLAEFGQDLPVELTLAAEQLASGRPVLLALDTTHKESVALFSLLRPQIEAELLWSYPKPGASGGLELWQIHDIPSYSASGTILSQEKGRV